MPTVFTIGEALIDFIPAEKGVGLNEVESFSRTTGGPGERSMRGCKARQTERIHWQTSGRRFR